MAALSGLLVVVSVSHSGSRRASLSLSTALERVLRTTPVKLIYLVPTFQNPTGRTIPLERRIEIARLIRHVGNVWEESTANDRH